MPTLLLFDGNAIIHRAYHALPKTFTDRQGRPTGAVYGFFLTFLAALNQYQPTHVGVIFDVAGPTFRDQLYEKYKAKRVKPPQEMYDQIPRIKEVLQTMHVPIVEAQGYEADDVIATMVAKIRNPKSEIRNKSQISNPKVQTVIITGDQDELQLVDHNVTVAMMRRGIKDVVEFTPEKVKEVYGFPPQSMADFKALAGDQSDNIPGLPGIGEKTARALIAQYRSIEILYRAIKNQSSHGQPIPEKTLTLLKQHRETAEFSKQLTQLNDQAPIDFSLAQAQLKADQLSSQPVIDKFKTLGFKSIIKRLTTDHLDHQPTHQNTLF